MTAEAGLVAARAFHIAALMVLFGAPAFALYGGALYAGIPAHALVRRWTWRLASWACGLALAAGVFWFLFTAATMTAKPVASVNSGIISLVGFGTGFGRIWLARLGLNVLLLVLMLPRADSRIVTAARIGAAGVLLASLAWVGHGTQGDGWIGTLHRVGDALHLLAASLWIGALALLAIGLAAARAGPGSAGAAQHLLLRFSGIGIGVVSVLLLTGLLNAWVLTDGAPWVLLGTRYGAVLAVKLVFFAAMLMLAAGNRYCWTPRLAAALESGVGREQALSALKTSIWSETALGFAVVMAVAWLGTLPPVPE